MKKEDLMGVSGKEYLPMIRPETEKLLRSLILKHKPKNILEIGTFLGYSAGVMCEISEDVKVVTLEKDEKSVRCAKENLQKFGSRVEILCCDAFQYLKQNAGTEKYDFVFLDGPKAQYKAYLPYIKAMLTKGGVLMADDVLFYGLVRSDEFIKHKHRTIVENLRKFLQALKDDKDFETQIFDFEDGVSVSIKRK